MDNEKKTPEQVRTERLKYAKRQRTVRTCAILLAIVLSLISMIQSCSTKKAIEDLAAQIAAKKAAQEQEQLLAQQEAATAAQTQAEVEATAKAQDAANLTLTFVGDCTLGVDETFEYEGSFTEYYDKFGETHFFKNVKSIFEGDDLTIANLEGTLTLSENRTDKLWAFKADPSYVNILTAGSVEAVSVANNHSHDYGNESYVDTLAHLDNAGITRFGYNNTRIVEVDGISVGLVSVYQYQDEDYWEQALTHVADLKAAGAEIISVSLHWGTEYQYHPGNNQIELAHELIDAGADVIVGHHPHVLQGIECYDGKYIAYSLGNFSFGGNDDPPDYDTMILQLNFPIENGQVSHDAEITIIPCSVSEEVGRNTYAPTPAEGAEAEAIMSKIYEISAPLTGGISRSTMETTNN